MEKNSRVSLNNFMMLIQLVTPLNYLQGAVKFNSIKKNNLDAKKKKKEKKFQKTNKYHWSVPSFLMKHVFQDTKENRISKSMVVMINTACLRCLDGGIAFNLLILLIFEQHEFELQRSTYTCIFFF